jgi:hypothetical protein
MAVGSFVKSVTNPERQHYLSRLILLLIGLSSCCPLCYCYYSNLDLVDWLEEFENCDVQVTSDYGETYLELDVGIFKYPVTLQTKKYNIGFHGLSDAIKTYYSQYRKRTFCTVQILVTTNRSLANGFWTPNVFGICSKPIFGLLTAPDASIRYKWTNCISIFVVPEDGMTKSKDQEMLQLDSNFSVEYFLDTQTYIFNYKKSPTQSNFLISSVDYICFHCLVHVNGKRKNAIVLQSNICLNKKCRDNMESTAAFNMEESRNIVSGVQSGISPFENLSGEHSRATKSWIPKQLLILPQHKAFRGLTTMSVREYYFYYRSRINFLRMNQAILFEHIPQNVTSFFNFTHSGLRDYNPTSNTENIDFKDLRYKSLIHRKRISSILYNFPMGNYPYYGNIYLTGGTFFNFLTCHGLHRAWLEME